MTITADNLVAREVHYCVSTLVSTLANGTPFGKGDLDDAVEQARDLCSSIDDWEEAALEAVSAWSRERLQEEGFRLALGDAPSDMSESHMRADVIRELRRENDFEEFCAQNDIEPYQREVFEHWIVSDWLADKLAEKGEKVDEDFAGLTVWARTTTGQGIASDSVIEAIVADLNK